MIPLFLGLTFANFAILLLALVAGPLAKDHLGVPTDFHGYHLALGILAGLMATLCHVATYTYFMATTKWLGAATDKADLALADYVEPAMGHKGKAFAAAMAAVLITGLTMFAGAGADVSRDATWTVHLHFGMAVITLASNFVSAVVEYHLIRRQGALMDGALEVLNAMPGVEVEGANASPAATATARRT